MHWILHVEELYVQRLRLVPMVGGFYHILYLHQTADVETLALDPSLVLQSGYRLQHEAFRRTDPLKDWGWHWSPVQAAAKGNESPPFDAWVVAMSGHEIPRRPDCPRWREHHWNHFYI